MARQVPMILAAVLGVLVMAPSALSADPSPVSGIDQYVEEVPTSGGGTLAGTAKPKHRTLPATLDRRIVEQGGDDAEALKEIATASAQGAPQSAPARAKSAGAQAANPTDGTAAPGDTSSGTSSDFGTDRLVALIAVLLAVSAAVVVTRLRADP